MLQIYITKSLLVASIYHYFVDLVTIRYSVITSCDHEQQSHPQKPKLIQKIQFNIRRTLIILNKPSISSWSSLSYCPETLLKYGAPRTFILFLIRRYFTLVVFFNVYSQFLYLVKVCRLLQLIIMAVIFVFQVMIQQNH